MFLNASTYYVDSFNAKEWHIYGSSRLGVYQRQINMASIRFQAGLGSGQFQSASDSTFNYAEADYSFHPIYRGHKNYELSNHLGNVLAVISDMKLYTCHQYNKFEDFENTPNIDGDWNIRDSWEGQNAVINLTNGKLHIVDSITSNPHVRVNYLLPKHLPPNQTYRIKFDLEHINGDHDWQIGIVSGNTDSTYEANFTFFSGSSGHNEITFQPTGHVWRIRFLHIPTAQDMEYNLDNFSLENLSIDSNLVAMADVLSATDYSPFGAPLAGRTYHASEYRFGFNGKEKDDETYGGSNEYDYGERIYNPRLGRWLSLDPLMAKYAYLSPYNFVSNSPLSMIDPDGRDNIIYLLILPDANSQLSKSDIADIARQANHNFESMGLKTRVHVVEVNKGPLPPAFDVSTIDKTDAVAVIGGSRSSTADFIKNNIDKERGIDLEKGWVKNPNFNPESSENGGNSIAINAGELQDWAQRTESSLVEGAAFLINHGAGHNADGATKDAGGVSKYYYHNETDGADVMNEGADLIKGVALGGELKDNLAKERNSKYIQGIKSKFGNNWPHDNRDKNKAANENKFISPTK